MKLGMWVACMQMGFEIAHGVTRIKVKVIVTKYRKKVSTQ